MVAVLTWPQAGLAASTAAADRPSRAIRNSRTLVFILMQSLLVCFLAFYGLLIEAGTGTR
jgi:hypothetical protein